MEIKLVNNLLEKIGLNKDEDSFNQIFDYFAPRINAYFIKTGSPYDASEELTQETLTAVWNKSYQFNSKKSNGSTWIFTIARNKRIDKSRKEKNPEYNEIDLISHLYDQKDSENSLVIENLNKKIIEKLAKNELDLIKMNFFEGKSHKNISETLEMPLGTVKSKLRAILLKLREINDE